MRYVAFFSIMRCNKWFRVNNCAKLLMKIIFIPKVMISHKYMNFNAFIGKFG